MTNAFEQTRNRLTDELAGAVSEAQHLLNSAESQVGSKAHELRHDLEASMHRAKSRLVGLEQQSLAQARNVAHKTDEFVHHRPWQAVGAAVVAGLVLGLLMNRR